MSAPIRVLTAVPICDGHDSAINTINLEFIRHGIEVVYLGFHRYVSDIVRAAIQEDVAAVGISSYNGGHIEFFAEAVKQLKKRGADDIRVFGGGGGTITHDDQRIMQKRGVDKIFFAGTALTDMVQFVLERYAKRPKRRATSDPEMKLARTRFYLESGRVLNSSCKRELAMARFTQAWLQAQVANALYPFFKYTDRSVKNYPYDIKKAKQLMAKSSVPKGFDVTILIPSEDQTKAQMMAVVKQLWAPLGVRVKIQTMETGALFTKYMNGDYEASDPLPSITSDVLVPDELALAWLEPGGVQHGFWSYYTSKKAWSLTLAANSSTDEAKRKKIFGQIQRLTLQDAPWIPMFFVPARTGLGAKVQNFHTLESGWWNLWEVWKS